MSWTLISKAVNFSQPKLDTNCGEFAAKKCKIRGDFMAEITAIQNK